MKPRHAWLLFGLALSALAHAQTSQPTSDPQPPSPVEITSIYPAVFYPETGTFKLSILGRGFNQEDPEDNEIEIKDKGALEVCWESTEAPPQCNEAYEIVASVKNSRQITLKGNYRGHGLLEGRSFFQVRVKSKEAISEPVPVTIPWVSSFFPESFFTIPWMQSQPRVVRWVPLAVSIVVMALILLFIIWLGLNGRSRNRYKIAGEEYFWTALLLDKESNTYSLSKFQFFLWTLVCVFGYSYLMWSRSLLQGYFEFPPFPEHFPGIILISGTAVAAGQSINAYQGPKGAGAVRPSWSDLITTGGVFALDRLQFLIWTLLGVGIYLYLLLFLEPGTVQELPDVPTEFLYLMGISSGGYVGTKLARGAGPVIQSVKVTPTQEEILFEVSGLSLSEKMTIWLDHQRLSEEELTKKLEIVKEPTETQIKQLKFACRLWEGAKGLDQPSPKEHSLTLTSHENKQEAIWNFDFEPRPHIKDVVSSKEGTDQVKLAIEGGNLSKKATITINSKLRKEPLTTANEYPTPHKDFAKELTITLPETEMPINQESTLKLTNPDGSSAQYKFTRKA